MRVPHAHQWSSLCGNAGQASGRCREGRLSGPSRERTLFEHEDRTSTGWPAATVGASRADRREGSWLENSRLGGGDPCPCATNLAQTDWICHQHQPAKIGSPTREGQGSLGPGQRRNADRGSLCFRKVARCGFFEPEWLGALFSTSLPVADNVHHSRV